MTTERKRLWCGAFALTLVAALAPAHAAGTEHTVYTFNAKLHGRTPGGGLVAVGNVFYGTTQAGGTGPCRGGCGTIYAVNAAGAQSVIYSFQNGADGANSSSALTLLNGVLYGTTQSGGAGGQGAIFAVTPSGAFTVLHAIAGISGGNEYGALTALGGVLYGMTYGGGTSGCGIAYAITPAGAYTLVHDFNDSGAEPCGTYGPLATDGTTLFGTSIYGGANGDGTVFSMTPSGDVHVIHAFDTAYIAPTGVTPFRGALYGMTIAGGLGLGEIYSVTLADAYHVIHDFQGTDGEEPLGTLTAAGSTLFGTTKFGGEPCAQSGCGVVFALAGGTRFSLLHSFSDADGQYPTATVIANGGALYGTTNAGGSFSQGVVFTIAH